eukprot:363711-Chlamydomonas_euryale.AAC.3
MGARHGMLACEQPVHIHAKPQANGTGRGQVVVAVAGVAGPPHLVGANTVSIPSSPPSSSPCPSQPLPSSHPPSAWHAPRPSARPRPRPRRRLGLGGGRSEHKGAGTSAGVCRGAERGVAAAAAAAAEWGRAGSPGSSPAAQPNQQQPPCNTSRRPQPAAVPAAAALHVLRPPSPSNSPAHANRGSNSSASPRWPAALHDTVLQRPAGPFSKDKRRY